MHVNRHFVILINDFVIGTCMKCHTRTGISFELTNGMNVSSNDFAPSRNHVERYRILYGSRWNGPVRE